MYSPCESITELGCPLPEIRRLALEEPGQSRFEVIQVSEALAEQVVLEGAEEVEVGKRQVGRVWWVEYVSPAQLFQPLAVGQSNVRPGIVVQQADFRPILGWRLNSWRV